MLCVCGMSDYKKVNGTSRSQVDPEMDGRSGPRSYFGLVDLALVSLIMGMIGFLLMVIGNGFHDSLDTVQHNVSPVISVDLMATFRAVATHPRVPSPCFG